MIMIDDGATSGKSMLAALLGVRRARATEVVVAVSVAPLSTILELWDEADSVESLHTPEIVSTVGEFYRDFHQVSDEEVKEILQQVWRGRARSQTDDFPA